MVEYDFKEIYESNKNTVWQIASRYIASPHDREDLFQDIFVNVHKALPKFRRESAVSTWVYRIAVNTAINYLKKKKRQEKLHSIFSMFRQANDEPRYLESSEELLKPLEKLNPRQKMVVVLADIEEKSLAEISAILRLPVGTVKSNLFRGREIVKKELMRNGGL